MEYWLATSPWPGAILWILLYVSDYYLTVYSAQGMKAIGHFKHEGSFELTPQYQKDIDALKPVSKQHIILLAIYTLIILLIWWLCTDLIGIRLLFTLYLGMFLLLEVAVHFRHLRNVFLIREIRANGGVDGEVTYRKWFSYKLSAFELYLFSALYLIVATVTYSPFFLGGAIMCIGMGLRHSRLSKKARQTTTVQA